VNSQQKKNRIVSSAQKTPSVAASSKSSKAKYRPGARWRGAGANAPAGDDCAAEEQGGRRQKEQRNAVDAD
jgi:hypothetical protein